MEQLIYAFGIYFFIALVISIIATANSAKVEKFKELQINRFGVHLNAMNEKELINFYFKRKNEKIRKMIINRLEITGFDTSKLKYK